MAEQLLANMFHQLRQTNIALAQNLTQSRDATQQQLAATQQQLIEMSNRAARTEDTMAAMQATMAALAARASERGVVDVKQVGKPENLSGKNSDEFARMFPNWAYTFTSWFGSQFVHGEEALEWARNSTDPIDDEVIEAKATEDDWSDLVRLNAQLHVALVSLC